MKSNEFLKEIEESGVFFKNFDEIYKEFQHFQKLAIETLNEFHRVCEKNKILYQLAYGSLLGAVRDGGQIPWDYDVDVFVFFNERKKLIEALKKDLDEKFYFYCPEVDEKCRHFFIRIAPKGYRTEVLHLDVFYLTGTPNNKSERDIFIKKIKELSRKRYQKLVKFKGETLNWKIFFKKVIGKLKTLNYNYDIEYDKYSKLCKLYSAKESDIIVTADIFSDWYEFSYDLFKESKLIKTDIGELRIPKNYDKILKIIYGDYHKVVSLDKRINEVMLHYNSLKKNALIK